MTAPFRTTADADLLSDAQFDPVFDQDGNLVDIIHLEINTDRSRGIRAMEELAASVAPGDEAVFADGWTGKWKRVLNTPAPGAAHSIKQSKRWNSQTGEFTPSVTLLVPFEVVWTMFDRLFFGRYSIDIEDIVYDTEDVVESPQDGARNLPGRVFYARARVAITLHLENGHTRKYTGIGVAYDSIKVGMTGNVFAINSARRMAEKGAVSDAKREALATIGRVFNRAYEDGAQAMRDIENKLLEKIRGVATSPRPVRSAVAAPRKAASPEDSPTTMRDGGQEDYIPMDAYESLKEGAQATVHKSKPAVAESANPKSKGKAASKPAKPVADAGDQKAKTTVEDGTADTQIQDTVTTKDNAKTDVVQQDTAEHIYRIIGAKGTQIAANPHEAFDMAIAAIEEAEGTQNRMEILERNKSTLLRAERDDKESELHYADLEAMVSEEAVETTNETLDETQEVPVDALRITPARTTGDAILKAYEHAFKTKGVNIDAVLMANTDWARQLTRKQTLQLAEMAAKAKS